MQGNRRLATSSPSKAPVNPNCTANATKCGTVRGVLRSLTGCVQPTGCSNLGVTTGVNTSWWPAGVNLSDCVQRWIQIKESAAALPVNFSCAASCLSSHTGSPTVLACGVRQSRLPNCTALRYQLLTPEVLSSVGTVASATATVTLIAAVASSTVAAVAVSIGGSTAAASTVTLAGSSSTMILVSQMQFVPFSAQAGGDVHPSYREFASSMQWTNLQLGLPSWADLPASTNRRRMTINNHSKTVDGTDLWLQTMGTTPSRMFLSNVGWATVGLVGVLGVHFFFLQVLLVRWVRFKHRAYTKKGRNSKSRQAEPKKTTEMRAQGAKIRHRNYSSQVRRPHC